MPPAAWARCHHREPSLFRTNREATAKAIGKALRHEPSIDWLLANQTQVTHYFRQLALDGQLEALIVLAGGALPRP